ncbi:MAG TPA: thiamine phosphate synthase [Polyangia bacterium]|jgi:thiamine-phosphate pyrophosphorylase|nr:thiamine phosphate synthase [Polyangia bacterium]
MAARDWLHGYYAILDVTPAELAAEPGDLAERAQRLLAAGPCCLQLRAKGGDAAALRDGALRLIPLCRAARVRFCMNDRLDVALAVGADVIHLGQDDLPLAEASRIVAEGGHRIVMGISTHNSAQAEAALAGGADYIALGPVFGTGSKVNPDPVVGLEMLAAVCRRASVPVVAIGGITLDRVRDVASAGAAAAAIIAAVTRAPDVTAAGRTVRAAFARP